MAQLQLPHSTRLGISLPMLLVTIGVKDIHSTQPHNRARLSCILSLETNANRDQVERRGSNSASVKERKAFLSTAKTRTEYIQRVYDLEAVTRSSPWDLLLFIESETQNNWDGIESMNKRPDWSSDWSRIDRKSVV